MSKRKQRLKQLVDKYWLLSALHIIYLWLFRRSRIAFVKYPSFQGWGMTTTTGTPWRDGGAYSIAEEFVAADRKLRRLVEDGEFSLTQFANMFAEKKTDAFLDELRWRHYLVYWSADYAVRMTAATEKNLVECGVCDGLTMYFAVTAARQVTESVTGHLYDAWEGMREEALEESEKHLAGEYDYLDIETTRRNLNSARLRDFVFNKGCIPEIFASKTGPADLVWLHIDLNASQPTLSALNHFWSRLERGGVVLLDDYALNGYEATKSVIDAWIADAEGVLLHFPTGQGLIVKT